MKRITLLWIALAFTLPTFAQVQTGAQGQQGQTAQRGNRGHRGGKVFKKMDKNNDRQISRDEWGRKPEAFDRLDLNKDGFLSGDELREVAKKRRNNQNPTQPSSL